MDAIPPLPRLGFHPGTLVVNANSSGVSAGFVIFLMMMVPGSGSSGTLVNVHTTESPSPTSKLAVAPGRSVVTTAPSQEMSASIQPAVANSVTE